MPHLGPFGVLGSIVGGLFLCIAGGILLCLGASWWTLRRVLRAGRACRECGQWGTELDTLIHECREHESK